MKREEQIEVASKYLKSKGYDIVCRDWSCEAGTADLVACAPSGGLVIVEVRPTRMLAGGWTAEKRAEREAVEASYAEHAGFGDERNARHDEIGISEPFGSGNVIIRHYTGMERTAA